jgi:hypothetical protein
VLVARTTVYADQPPPGAAHRRGTQHLHQPAARADRLGRLAPGSGNTGDIAVTLKGEHRLGYAMLWPHARPWRLSRPQPMLRALPDAARLAQELAQACAALAPVASPARRTSQCPAPVRPTPALEGAGA